MPTKSFNSLGWRGTGTIRLRSSWFGFCRAEELYENQDGSFEWRPLLIPLTIRQGK